MNLSRQSDGELQVSGDLHIQGSQEFRQLLLREVESEPTNALRLDLSAVDRCDTASLQLLCSLAKSVKNAGKEFYISSPSVAVREVSKLLGLSLKDLESFHPISNAQ